MWDGFQTNENARVMVLAATNRPWEVDEAILRRLPRSFEVGLPNLEQRIDIIKVILKDEHMEPGFFGPGPDPPVLKIAKATDRYSGSDLGRSCARAPRWDPSATCSRARRGLRSAQEEARAKLGSAARRCRTHRLSGRVRGRQRRRRRGLLATSFAIGEASDGLGRFRRRCSPRSARARTPRRRTGTPSRSARGSVTGAARVRTRAASGRDPRSAVAWVSAGNSPAVDASQLMQFVHAHGAGRREPGRGKRREHAGGRGRRERDGFPGWGRRDHAGAHREAEEAHGGSGEGRGERGRETQTDEKRISRVRSDCYSTHSFEPTKLTACLAGSRRRRARSDRKTRTPPDPPYQATSPSC